jgi:hypothetical protein
MCLSNLKTVIARRCSKDKLYEYADRYGTRIAEVVLCYGVLWSVLGNDALPKLSDSTAENGTLVVSNLSNDSVIFYEKQRGLRRLLDVPYGHFFALFVLLITSSLFGFAAKLLYLPPLTGMLISGFTLRNVPRIDVASNIHPLWSSTIRNFCLVVVLIRGGLSLDAHQLKRLKLAVFLLAMIPCICEGAADGLVSTFLLPLPWKWGLMLGYVLAAISPAVVIPTMLHLQKRHYGVTKGITTLIVAAASVDVVTAVSLFGVFLGLVFSEGSLVLDIFRAPIQIILGLAYGVIFGLLLWILPSRRVSVQCHGYVVVQSRQCQMQESQPTSFCIPAGLH